MNLQEIKSKLASPFIWTIAVLGGLVLLYRNKALNLQALLGLFKASNKDANLEGQKTQLKEEESKFNTAKTKAELDFKSQVEQAKNMSTKEVEEFYKKQQGN